jgi:hypothetical protein
MAKKIQQLRHNVELLRRPKNRCVQPKGMRKRNVFLAGEETEENSSKAHQIYLISELCYFN